MVALALVVGALCGRSAVLSVTDTSSTSLGSPHLDRDLDAEVLWNQTAQDEMDAGNQTAQEEAALGLNLEVLCGGGNSKIKVKFSMHSILNKVGVTKCLLGLCVPNPKVGCMLLGSVLATTASANLNKYLRRSLPHSSLPCRSPWTFEL